MRRMRKAVLVVTAFAVFLVTGLSVVSLGVGTLFAQEPCPGDIDCDGTVDGADVAALAASFGSTGCSTQNQSLPLGSIIMWSGEINEDGHPILEEGVLTGWRICDGSDNDQSTISIPDLNDKFILGTDRVAEPHTGGVNSHRLTIDQMPTLDHYLSIETGEDNYTHDHSWTMDFDNEIDDTGDSDLFRYFPHGSRTSQHTSSDQHIHSHGVSGYTQLVGGGASFDNRPAFYRLAFIIKVN
jgi:hypothetical protein